MAFVLVLNGMGTYAGAVEATILHDEVPAICATGKFNMDIAANTAVQAESSFQLEAGEFVTIKASYSPFSASVDFGLIAPDGDFYYINVNNGSIDQAIEVDQRGKYIFAVRNNSSAAISVSGYVNY